MRLLSEQRPERVGHGTVHAGLLPNSSSIGWFLSCFQGAKVWYQIKVASTACLMVLVLPTYRHSGLEAFEAEAATVSILALLCTKLVGRIPRMSSCRDRNSAEPGFRDPYLHTDSDGSMILCFYSTQQAVDVKYKKIPAVHLQRFQDVKQRQGQEDRRGGALVGPCKLVVL